MTEKIVTNFYKEIATKLSSFNENKKIIDQACSLAREAHNGQFRKYSGNPYINHPLQVALTLAEKFDDLELVLAGILHDVIEDCEHISRKEIYNKFGRNVGFITDSVSKNYSNFYLNKSKTFNDKIEKFLYGGLQDIKCLLLKVADRSHNLKTLQGLKNEKQIRISFETQAIYEPLKKLLNWNNTNNVTALTNSLHGFVQTKQILTASDFKEKLLQETFDSFNNNTFNLVYRNSQHFIWRISDWDTYKLICKQTDLNGKIKLVSLKTNGNWINCSFKFEK